MLIVLFLCLLAYVLVLYNNKNYIKPDNLLGVYWVFNIFFGLAMFNSTYKWNVYPLIYILFCCMIFSVGFRIGVRVRIGNISVKEGLYKDVLFVNDKFIKLSLIIGIGAGCIYAVDLLRINGFSVMMAINSFRTIGNYFNNTRYFGEGEKNSFIGQVCLTVYYSSFVLGGLFYKRISSTRIYIILDFIPGIFNMFCTTTKTIIIGPILLWISGYLVEKRLFGEVNVLSAEHKNSIKNIFKFVILIIVMYYALFKSFVIRYGGTTYTNIHERIAVYALGHIPCFDNIFASCNFTLLGEGFGYYTFTWLCKLIGLKSLIPKGTYAFGLNTLYGFTNVPTIFTDFIMDFGYIGALLECLILGVFVGVLYKYVKSNNGIVIGLLGLAYYCILYSFLVNPMRYSTIVGAYMLIPVYLYFERKIKM